MNVTRPTVIDDFFPLPVWLRETILTLPVQSVTLGDETFHGIRLLSGDLQRALAALFARLLPKYAPTLMFARQSPEGQPEPNYIHSDADMGDLTGIAYLTRNPPAADGLKFWEHVESRQQRTAWSPAVQAEAQDLSRWSCWKTVPAAFGRLVLFPSDYTHSRAIPENFGTGDDARLILVVFFKGWAGPGEEYGR